MDGFLFGQMNAPKGGASMRRPSVVSTPCRAGSAPRAVVVASVAAELAVVAVAAVAGLALPPLPAVRRQGSGAEVHAGFLLAVGLARAAGGVVAGAPAGVTAAGASASIVAGAVAAGACGRARGGIGWVILESARRGRGLERLDGPAPCAVGGKRVEGIDGELVQIELQFAHGLSRDDGLVGTPRPILIGPESAIYAAGRELPTTIFGV
jgi:hypothetical protein